VNRSEAGLSAVNEQIVVCRACPRLVEWRERVAREKRAGYAGETYWGRPLPGFGDPDAAVLIVGLAPAAHGGNRTGRMFTGDRSGDWLFGSLYRTGFANQPVSKAKGDGLRLNGAYIGAVVRCAPPANKPKVDERDRCLGYLVSEIDLLPQVKVIVALGSFAWDGVLRAVARRATVPKPRPRFGHHAEIALGGLTLLGCYHPSQQNTFTGKLTQAMLDSVFERARKLAGRQVLGSVG
jgi:uracil-DNA glycosylase family 4